MRLFAAVTPPAIAIEHLAEQVRPAQDTRLTWSDLAAWHVTLAFYGDVDDTRVTDLTDRLSRAAKRHQSMELRLSGSGRFGTAVLWIGVQGDVEPLRRLALATVAAGRRMGLGHEETRRFRPHVTLARSGHRHDLRSYVTALARYDGPTWHASHVTLVRSHLGAGPGGRARHEPIAELPLGGGHS